MQANQDNTRDSCHLPNMIVLHQWYGLIQLSSDSPCRYEPKGGGPSLGGASWSHDGRQEGIRFNRSPSSRSGHRHMAQARRVASSAAAGEDSVHPEQVTLSSFVFWGSLVSTHGVASLPLDLTDSSNASSSSTCSLFRSEFNEDFKRMSSESEPLVAPLEDGGSDFLWQRSRQSSFTKLFLLCRCMQLNPKHSKGIWETWESRLIQWMW